MASLPVDFALSKLDKLVTSKANLLLGLEYEIEYCKSKLEFLRAFLVDANQKRRQKQHEYVRICVKQLREVAYDLEDLLDEYTVKLDLQRMGLSGWRASPWLHCCISPNTQLFIRHDLASKIRKIKATLEEIASNKATFIDPTDLSSSSQDCADMRINNLRNEVETEPTGQNAYVQELIPQILNHNANRLAILSICGMGGLGKTTLAMRLYNDRAVISHFNLRAWLTISQTFSFVDLLRRLMNQFNFKVEDQMKMKEEEMKKKLEDHLSKKSLIIVLDDIWEVSSWDYLKTILPREHEGITVILTTRDKKVATDVNPDSEPFELQPLEPKEAWELFRRKTFADAKCPENFKIFKNDIIEKSKRLPLAIVVLGGLLRKRKDPDQWKRIFEHSGHEDDETLSILYLSYDYLPQHLKACFLYVAGYPEDYEIDAKELIRLWIAEGFIEQQQEQMMEDSAEGYLEELMQRSLIQLVERDYTGQASLIRVHGFVLDMARKEAQEINFLHQNISQLSSMPERRVSLYDEDDIHLIHVSHNSTIRLRSLCILCTGSTKVFPSKYFDLVSNFFLIVLSLKGIIFPNGKCPEEIGNMRHLRYLCFAAKTLTELANNISNLQCLQTLDIRDTEVTQLPEKFWKIKSLRHVLGGRNLEISDYVGSKLNELQSLIGRPDYKWIQNLTNIRELHMYGDSGHKDPRKKMEVKLIAAIESLKHLTFLVLEGVLASPKVLTASNTSLRRLELRNRKEEKVEPKRHPVRKQPLPNLLKLDLWDFNLTQDDIDAIGLLPKLKYMSIKHEHKITELVFKDGYFSCLEGLELLDCQFLKSWEINGAYRLLELLQIQSCPQLRLLPKRIQVKEVQLGHGITEDVRLYFESSTNTIVKEMSATSHRG